MYGPREINQEWQNRGVEDTIRGLARRARAEGRQLQLMARATGYARDELPIEISNRLAPGEAFLKEAHYVFQAVDRNGAVIDRFEVTLQRPALRAGEPLPTMLDFYNIRFGMTNRSLP